MAAQQPILYMHRVGNISLTTYSRAAADQLFADYPHIRGRAAYWFTGGAPSQIIKHYVMKMYRTRWRGMTIQEFKDKPAGLAWLAESLVKESEAQD